MNYFDERKRGDIGRPEMQRDPIFLYQTTSSKDRDAYSARWETRSVWFTREEAEKFAQQNEYNHPVWRVYCVSACGILADILSATDDDGVRDVLTAEG
jgi:hypothetical protein